jgi:hypothetical protein
MFLEVPLLPIKPRSHDWCICQMRLQLCIAQGAKWIIAIPFQQPVYMASTACHTADGAKHLALKRATLRSHNDDDCSDL